MIKQFDFPIVFRYIVGYLQISKQNNQKQKQKIRQHISLPNRYPSERYHHYQYQTNLHPVNHTKQYSFGKKRLVQIRYIPQKKQKTQISQSISDRKSTIFDQINLRKLQSHKTHASNIGNQQNYQQNKSLKSFRTTNKRNINSINSKNINKNGTLKKLNTNNNDLNRQSHNLLQQQKNNIKTNTNINKKPQQQLIRKSQPYSSQQSNNSNIMSILPSKKSLYNNNQYTSSKRNNQRFKTQFIQLNNYNNILQQSSLLNKSQIKKVTNNFMLRKQKNKNMTKINHRQKINQQQKEEDNNKENYYDGYNGDNYSKNKTFFKVSDGYSHITNQQQSMKKIQSKRNINKLILLQQQQNNNNKKKSPNNNRVFFNDDQQQYEYTSDTQTGSQKLISQEALQTKLFVRRIYRLKTQKIFRKNCQSNRLKQKLHQEEMLRKQFGQQDREFLFNKGKNLRKGQRVDSNMFRKKQLENPANYIGNTKLIRRVRRQSGQDEVIIPSSSHEMIPSSSNLSKKPVLFNKNNPIKQKQQTFNVFTQLNNFHSMMQTTDPLIDDDDKLSQLLSNKKLGINPFKLLSQDSNRNGQMYQKQRKLVFEYDEKMFKFTKKIVNKSNQLKQV